MPSTQLHSDNCDEMQPLRMSVASIRGCAVLQLAGELDVSTAPDLSRLIASVEPGCEALVVDLSDLMFIDSQGIRTLMSARYSGQPLALICPRGHISRVLEIVHADRFMPVYTRLDEFLDAHSLTPAEPPATPPTEPQKPQGDR
jgi:anti-anti-sigma factor